MKNNHLKVENLIRQAIVACSYDSALSETKSFLTHALNKVQATSNKRTRRANTQKENEAAAKTKQEEWWEMLKKNAAKNVDLSELGQDEKEIL